MRRALQLALEQGQGRETAVIYGNLAWVVWFYQGPQAALDAYGEGIAFCERRGITEVTLHMRGESLSLLAELGQTEQALAEAGPLADRLQAAGDIDHVSTRALQLRLLAERGTPQQAPTPDELVTAARDMGLPGFIALAFAAAAQLLLAQLTAVRTELGSELPSVLRVALALGDPPLAERLAAGTEPTTPLREHALASAHAQLAEAAGDHTAAVELYQQAAERWRQFGNVPERAYALLGQGRCLATLGKPEAEGPLREARDLFTTLAYQPALAESRALLGESEAAAV